MELLQSQHEKLRESSEERKEEIKKAANDVEAVGDNLRRMRTSIDRAADELEMHEPIGSDVNAIKRLQDELRVRQLSWILQCLFDEHRYELNAHLWPKVNKGLLKCNAMIVTNIVQLIHVLATG